jgi:hypothetical protein
MGFGLVTEFIGTLKLVNKINNSAIVNSHTQFLTRAHMKSPG